MQRLAIDIPEHIHKQLKIRAAEEKTTMKDIVLAWILSELKTSA